MKKILPVLFLFLVSISTQAQWITLNSGTSVNLHDVDFLDANEGIIVGDAGTILRTVDGGLNWTDINNGLVSGDIQRVKMLNADTFYVSTYSTQTFAGEVYITENGGTSWNQVATDNTSNHPLDLASNDGTSIYRLGSMLSVSSDNGNSWNTMINGTGGTTSLFSIKFADDSVGHASGNISGFTGYSCYFYRTGDGGAHWYANDLNSYLNADALTSMCFVNQDTAMLFTNDYNGFMPSNINKLVMTSGYYQSILISGDTVYSFTSQMINAAMPAYMNDGAFVDADTGYAFGDDGTVYKTTDAGVSWSPDYPTGVPLFASSFAGGTGYAVGNNGKVIKLNTISGTSEISATSQVRVYPTITSSDIHIDFKNTQAGNFEIFSSEGKLVSSGAITNKATLNVSEWSKGVYVVKLTSGAGTVVRKFVVK